MNSFNKLLYFVPFVLLAACGIGSDSAGNTTEIENAIAIRVFDDGAPAANIRYQVCKGHRSCHRLRERYRANPHKR